MKYIITEDQLDRIKDEILTIPYSAFNNNWDVLQKFLNKRGNPPYILRGDVDLSERKDIVSLGSLVEVKGSLDLSFSQIESLGNLTSVDGYFDLRFTPIKSLGNLTSVEGSLFLIRTPIEDLGNLTSVGRLNLTDTSIESLGKLTYVGGDLLLRNTPISKKYTRQQIIDMVEVGGGITL